MLALKKENMLMFIQELFNIVSYVLLQWIINCFVWVVYNQLIYIAKNIYLLALKNKK